MHVLTQYLEAWRSGRGGGGGGKERKITGRVVKILAQLSPTPHTHPYSTPPPSLHPAVERQYENCTGVQEGQMGCSRFLPIALQQSSLMGFRRISKSRRRQREAQF